MIFLSSYDLLSDAQEATDPPSSSLKSHSNFNLFMCVHLFSPIWPIFYMYKLQVQRTQHIRFHPPFCLYNMALDFVYSWNNMNFI